MKHKWSYVFLEDHGQGLALPLKLWDTVKDFVLPKTTENPQSTLDLVGGLVGLKQVITLYPTKAGPGLNMYPKLASNS